MIPGPANRAMCSRTPRLRRGNHAGRELRSVDIECAGLGAAEHLDGHGGRDRAKVEHLLAREFNTHKINSRLAPMYSQMLVGMVALTGQWWLDVRKPRKEEVVAHLVNLAWNGLEHMDPKPKLITNVR